VSEQITTPGEVINLQLKERKLRQKHLAQELGIDAATLNKWIKGEDRVPREYFAPAAACLGMSDQQVARLHILADIQKWQDRLQHAATKSGFRKFGIIPDSLGEYVQELATALARIDAEQDAATSYEQALAKQLNSGRIVLESIGSALDAPDDTLIFSGENIAPHLRYPSNYHVSWILAVRDDRLKGGNALAENVHRLIETAADYPETGKFLGRLARQHARHIAVRYGPDREEAPYARGLRQSEDVQEQRMVLMARALRTGATERDWSSLLDRLDKDDGFRHALAVFDTSHYDGERVGGDGWQPKPTVIRSTILRSLAGLDDSDEHMRALALCRLDILLSIATPDMIRDVVIAAKTDDILGRMADKSNHSAIGTLNVIRNANKS
jgi:plasmid maintenance system antidote protein VapI